MYIYIYPIRHSLFVYVMILESFGIKNPRLPWWNQPSTVRPPRSFGPSHQASESWRAKLVPPNVVGSGLWSKAWGPCPRCKLHSWRARWPCQPFTCIHIYSSSKFVGAKIDEDWPICIHMPYAPLLFLCGEKVHPAESNISETTTIQLSIWREQAGVGLWHQYMILSHCMSIGVLQTARPVLHEKLTEVRQLTKGAFVKINCSFHRKIPGNHEIR